MLCSKTPTGIHCSQTQEFYGPFWRIGRQLIRDNSETARTGLCRRCLAWTESLNRCTLDLENHMLFDGYDVR